MSRTHSRTRGARRVRVSIPRSGIATTRRDFVRPGLAAQQGHRGDEYERQYVISDASMGSHG
jgi:hypothetical protein